VSGAGEHPVGAAGLALYARVMPSLVELEIPGERDVTFRARVNCPFVILRAAVLVHRPEGSGSSYDRILRFAQDDVFSRMTCPWQDDGAGGSRSCRPPC